jgi:hypothetical protein
VPWHSFKGGTWDNNSELHRHYRGCTYAVCGGGIYKYRRPRDGVRSSSLELTKKLCSSSSGQIATTRSSIVFDGLTIVKRENDCLPEGRELTLLNGLEVKKLMQRFFDDSVSRAVLDYVVGLELPARKWKLLGVLMI